MSERNPRLEGGACSDLAPGIAAKYFDINPQTQAFERKTAIAICGNCAIRAICLETAMNKPEYQLHGVVAGKTPSQVRILKQWRDYDLGIVNEIPKRPRPEVADIHQPEAGHPIAEYRRTAQMTFEERVRGVFIDLRAGKYNETGGISQAIGAIAFIREQMAVSDSVQKRATT